MRLDVTVQSVGVHDVIDLDPAFTAISGGRAAALFTMVDPFTLAHRKQIVEFAAQHRLPAIYEPLEFVVAGSLVSYGPSNTAMQRRCLPG
jgi:putative ABC transport system substrate-binding protein